MLKNIWIFAECLEHLAELAHGGRNLAENVTAVIAGSEANAVKTSCFGVDKVLWIEFDSDNKMLEDVSDTIAGHMKEAVPEALLLYPSKRTRLIAGRMAAILGCSAIVDARNISQIDGKISAEHLVYSGLAYRTERALKNTALIIVNPRELPGSHESNTTRVGSKVEVTASSEAVIEKLPFIVPKSSARVIKRKPREKVEINLSEAKRVVCVGRGLDAVEDIAIIEQLAHVANAEIACTRPLSEANGWLPCECWIGVSGTMLKPDIYFGIGVSGSMQHMAGANRARIIIAINNNRNALIFRQVDYGIVGDMYKVVPALLEKL